MRLFLTIFSFFITGLLSAQNSGRSTQRINDNWSFQKVSTLPAQWKKVTLPHTWNADDVMDDEPGYYRGTGRYKRKLILSQTLSQKEIFLFFEGANQHTQVYINGKMAGQHIGGYSGFYIRISHLVDFTKPNEIVVDVDNSHDETIPPLSADFTFYGGIYRDVWLLTTDRLHFTIDSPGTTSLYIKSDNVSRQHADILIRGSLTNTSNIHREVRVITSIRDAKKHEVGRQSMETLLNAGKDISFALSPLTIKEPRLWSPDTPYLYTVVTEIRDRISDKLLDQISTPFGIRWFHMDAKEGFFLNGKSLKLVGTSRHQDYKGLGNAVPDKLAIEDVRLVKAMGGNFLRIAHYPQDPSVLDACDSLGIITSVEIPIVNEIAESDTFFSNCLMMQREMIRQHYNHPSIIMWCYMNEVLLRPRHTDDKPRQAQYFKRITQLATSLDSLTRKEDPARYTMMAHHGDYKKYLDNGLVSIPMLVGWNLYSGWYGGKLNDFASFLDSFHARHPDKPLLVTEYGADADPRIRSLEPVRFDKSVEYTTAFHQFYLDAMLKRPFVAAAMVWNLADFNSETRSESMPHINNKGLLQWDRTPKDAYYYYQAMLSGKPFIKILGDQSVSIKSDSTGKSPLRAIQVATNGSDAELFVNGQSAGKKNVVNGLATWSVTFTKGLNKLLATSSAGDKNMSDRSDRQVVFIPSRFDAGSSTFVPLRIMLGSKRYYTDSEKKDWVPDQPYAAGSWGFIGGNTFTVVGNSRLPYGTDKNINGTTDDPIYQTQRVGLEKYKLDVPDGEYEVTLHFAELLGGTVRSIPYNLADPDRIEPNGQRVFHVAVNGEIFLNRFDLSGLAGSATAIKKSVRVAAANDKGIEIAFTSIEGEPVLNALELKCINKLKSKN